jgi:deoxyribodipyrimidine photo-lyase
MNQDTRSVLDMRARFLNSRMFGDGPVLYWMNRDMRVRDNWALVYAYDLAKKHNTHVVIAYNLVVKFLHGGKRQLEFKTAALRELESDCLKKHIPFRILVDETGTETATKVLSYADSIGAGAIVTDFSPLRISRRWSDVVRKKATIPVIGVDTHNIVPVWAVSNKQEFGAYTLRPKLHRLLPQFMDMFPAIRSQKVPIPERNDWIHINSLVSEMSGPAVVDWIIPGEASAHKTLTKFLRDVLPRYATDRNDPNANVQSNLSPYLHYGMISAQTIALAVCDWVGMPIEKILHHAKNKANVQKDRELKLVDHAAAFLEELIVRRELSDNFCFYNESYDSINGFPDWAKKSHGEHANDPREYVYSRSQFEHAKTHDFLWNAAQKEMVCTGKMHSYMRMYWAKKILEWTRNPEEAMKIAIYLNDRYELDGRDPNGYAGIAWSIGGVHDRAWFERSVFGQIRYMNENGCRSKFDVDTYIKRWINCSESL